MTIEVFGVTGTNGKTTVSYMLKSILEEAGKRCGMVGTITHQIGEHEHEAINTTPSKELFRQYFKEMKEQDMNTCLMEISSHGLEQGRVDEIEIHHSGFTNLTQDHLDYHHNMENYYNAKAKLFYMTKQSMCLNVDDTYGKRLYKQLLADREIGKIYEKIKISALSFEDKECDFYGEIIENSVKGITMRPFIYGEDWGKLKLKMPGRTTAYNGMLAAAIAAQAGICKENIIAGLEKLSAVPGRFQRVESGRNVDVIIDFAHTPDALENLLKTARELKSNKLICIFGCGGNRDKEKRKIMGRLAGENADLCIITSDNPRYEKPLEIMEEIEKGIKETSCEYIMEEDRKKAIEMAIELYNKGNLIVIAGKGHEKYQLINGEKLPFDDEMTVRTIIK